MRPIWTDRLAFLEAELAKTFTQETPLPLVRQRISDLCANAAVPSKGVYRLNVPTGGGKTLSAARFALTHAAAQNKSRIIFTAPLLSILDQNAQIIRRYVGDDTLILEHHSNLVEPDTVPEHMQELELLTASWESPIIITTLVQLLNTCFSGKNSALRRFHALCNSVIVIDEVQTVPSKMLTLFNLAVNFLSEICNATIVLCSATQPCLEVADHPLYPQPVDLVPRQTELWDVFKRTDIQNAGQARLEECPQLILQTLEQCRSLLVVCISTAVIEAGVDISFQQVIRFSTGMDSVVQAAGHCNRHAEQEQPAPVHFIRCTDERLHCLDDIIRGQNATTALLTAFSRDPEQFRHDLSSDESIRFYYRRLYAEMEPGFQDDRTPEHGSLYQLLSDNPRYADAVCTQAQPYFMRQAFRLAGSLFQVFDEDTVSLLVPYEKGRDLQNELRSASQAYGQKDWQAIRHQMQQAKGYCVSVYRYQLKQLQSLGAVTSLFDGGIHLLADGFYDKHTGFSIESGTLGFQDV